MAWVARLTYRANWPTSSSDGSVSKRPLSKPVLQTKPADGKALTQKRIRPRFPLQTRIPASCPIKEGGYAPNYTPTATTDGERGFIVDVDVLSVVNEGEAAAASVDRIEETFGKKPEKFLTDAGNNSGQIMAEMEERGVEFYAPVESNQPEEGSPAKRDDPR